VRALRVDALGGWAVLGSLALHAALLSAAVTATTFGAKPFVPGEAREAAGLSVPLVASAPVETARETTTPPPAPLPTRAPAPARLDASTLAPATLVDATDIPTEFVAPLASPLLQAQGDASSGASAMRSTPTVFGVSGQREAERVVYLVDASGSMVAALPVVMREVARSIDALAPDQRFTVGVFGFGGIRSPDNLASGRDGMIVASESNKAAIRRWLRSVEARGGGDALDAIRWGLERRPDIVFLMAKGITDRGQTSEQRERSAERFLEEVERMNPKDASSGLRPVRISAIEFFDADAVRLLQRLGEEHGEFGGATEGSGHRFISRRELGLE
jgi:hypothetical protein